MNQLLTDILREITQALTQFRDRTLATLSLLTGVGKLWAIIIFAVIAIELLTFLLFIPLHRHILKKLDLAKQALVKQIDEIIYLLTKAQYESHISKKDLGGDPCMAMMKEMFTSGHFEYLDNISVIKEDVGKVELLIWKQVATPEQWEIVHTFQKKMKRLMFRSALFGRIITIFTLGVYRLFW